MTQSKNLFYKKILFTLSLGIAAVLAVQGVFLRYGEFLSKGSIVVSFVVVMLVILTGSIFILLLIWAPSSLGKVRSIKRIKLLSWMSALLVILLPVFLYLFHRWSEPFGDIRIRIFLYGASLIIVAWLLEPEEGIRFRSLLKAALIQAVVFTLLSNFRDVNGYPFSVGWSEGNRFWDYSVRFGRHLYDWPQDKPIPAYIDPGRQSLWGLIFLLPGVSIQAMRAWNDILFIVPCLVLGWALFRAHTVGNELRIAVIFWSMLFLLQGPIYTPLILSAILIALTHRGPNWLFGLGTIVASYYAIMSRSTWILGPTTFAVLLAILDRKDSNQLKGWRTLRPAILIGLCGLLGVLVFLKQNEILRIAGFRSKVTPIVEVETLPLVVDSTTDDITGVEPPPSMFTPEGIRYFLERQPLLWSRLLPNEIYPSGILLGLLLAVAPLLIVLTVWRLKARPSFSGLQDWLSGLILLGLLFVGLIISVKIGGGSNLHNLDMFLIALLFVAAAYWNTGMADWLQGIVNSEKWLNWVLLAAVILPVAASMLTVEPKKYPAAEKTADSLAQVQRAVETYREGEILFMDQRQLLTFGFVPKIPLIADYEKKWMMDEAMADHGAWFEPYLADLRAHRFNLIVSEPLQIQFQGANKNFSEENDLFVKWVSIPTLCYYQPLETFPEDGVQLLVPRTEPFEYPEVSCP
jgi:hypothetical protein